MPNTKLRTRPRTKREKIQHQVAVLSAGWAIHVHCAECGQLMRVDFNVDSTGQGIEVDEDTCWNCC